MTYGGERTSVGAGRYALEEVVGRGGMATVYRATDTALKRGVAVKIMDHANADDSFRTRFRREARAVAALNHGNVIAVHDIGEEPALPGGAPTPYLVMEYVDGRSLSDMISNGPLPLAEALRVTADVLAGLAASHEAGLVHRDVKPANVMVTARGTVKVLDFGIARALRATSTAVTRDGTVVGTAPYMSPEQARGLTLDPRSDLYSTGVMLFELLAGRRPFEAESVPTVLYQHVYEYPPLLSEVGVAVSPEVQRLVSSALAKDPDQRPCSAAEMRAIVLALRQSTGPAEPPRPAHRPLPTMPVSAPLRPPPPPTVSPVTAARSAVRQRRLLVAGLTIAPIGYVVGGYGLLTLFRNMDRLPDWVIFSVSRLLAYGVVWGTVIAGLWIGVRLIRTTVDGARHSLAVLCALLNSLYALYLLGAEFGWYGYYTFWQP